MVGEGGDHHEEGLALKSPVTTDKDGLRLFMLLELISTSSASLK